MLKPSVLPTFVLISFLLIAYKPIKRKEIKINIGKTDDFRIPLSDIFIYF